jgi:hypothetical protein
MRRPRSPTRPFSSASATKSAGGICPHQRWRHLTSASTDTSSTAAPGEGGRARPAGRGRRARRAPARPAGRGPGPPGAAPARELTRRRPPSVLARCFCLRCRWSVGGCWRVRLVGERRLPRLALGDVLEGADEVRVPGASPGPARSARARPADEKIAMGARSASARKRSCDVCRYSATRSRSGSDTSRRIHRGASPSCRGTLVGAIRTGDRSRRCTRSDRRTTRRASISGSSRGRDSAAAKGLRSGRSRGWPSSSSGAWPSSCAPSGSPTSPAGRAPGRPPGARGSRRLVGPSEQAGLHDVRRGCDADASGVPRGPDGVLARQRQHGGAAWRRNGASIRRHRIG